MRATGAGDATPGLSREALDPLQPLEALLLLLMVILLVPGICHCNFPHTSTRQDVQGSRRLGEPATDGQCMHEDMILKPGNDIAWEPMDATCFLHSAATVVL